MNLSQIQGYPEIIRDGMQKAFDRVLLDSTLIISADCDICSISPMASVSYKIVNCELPLGNHQVPLFTKVIKKSDELAKKSIARYLNSQGAQIDEDILNNGMGNIAWKIGVKFDVLLTIPGTNTQYSYDFFAQYSSEEDNSDGAIDEDGPYAKQILSCFYDFEDAMDTLWTKEN